MSFRYGLEAASYLCGTENACVRISLLCPNLPTRYGLGKRPTPCGTETCVSRYPLPGHGEPVDGRQERDPRPRGVALRLTNAARDVMTDGSGTRFMVDGPTSPIDVALGQCPTWRRTESVCVRSTLRVRSTLEIRVCPGLPTSESPYLPSQSSAGLRLANHVAARFPRLLAAQHGQIHPAGIHALEVPPYATYRRYLARPSVD